MGSLKANLGTAAIMAEYCQLVYFKPESVEVSLKQKYGFNQAKFLECGKDAQLFVASNEQEVIICFRGTDSKTDWFDNNFNIKFIKGPFGKEVHAGFLKEAKTCVTNLLPLLEHALEDNHEKKIVITGHSLGGALAVLTTALLKEKGYSIFQIFTFGCPRSGDRPFARIMNKAFPDAHFRFVNNNDLVPRVPLKSFHYQHCGVLGYFNRNGRLYTQMGLPMVITDRTLGFFKSLFKGKVGDSIRDHKMSHYLQLIQDQLPDTDLKQGKPA